MVFHTQIVLSQEPETMCWPSGENATEFTGAECPLNGPDTVSPVIAFHTQIVPLFKPETMHWPSGETAMELTGATCDITISDDGQWDNCPLLTCSDWGNMFE